MISVNKAILPTQTMGGVMDLEELVLLCDDADLNPQDYDRMKRYIALRHEASTARRDGSIELALQLERQARQLE